MQIQLSRHFREKWRSRFGAEPETAEIERIIRRGPWVARCRDLRGRDGRLFRTLAVYVDFDHRVAVKIDEVNGVAVTFVTEHETR